MFNTDLGDKFSFGEDLVMKGDCYNLLDSFKEKMVDLIVTDPPYILLPELLKVLKFMELKNFKKFAMVMILYQIPFIIPYI